MTPQETMHSIIQRIATGPELSKDISLEEAEAGMQAILQGEIDDVQSAVFFIALRMKRETDDENKGVLKAILEQMTTVTADVEELVSLADPYDGFNRNLPVAPFIPPLLAEAGLAAVSQGLNEVGPKFGVTHRHVLQAAGVNVDISVEEASKRISDPNIGWAYVDQSQFCPGLHALTPLRKKIIKRQILTTVEVLAKPIQARGKTHLVTGYVHKPYPPKYASLARFAGFEGALLVRGTEGGVIPSLRQPGMVYRYLDFAQEEPFEIQPADLGIKQEMRAVPLPDHVKASATGDEVATISDISSAAKAAAETGLNALKGEAGPAYDSLLYAASLILWHCGRASNLAEAATMLRPILDSGSALKRIKS